MQAVLGRQKGCHDPRRSSVDRKTGDKKETSFCIVCSLFVNDLFIPQNRPGSIYQYSSMAPRLSGQNCNFFQEGGE